LVLKSWSADTEFSGVNSSLVHENKLAVSKQTRRVLNLFFMVLKSNVNG
jgi:hypothetical protein